MFKKYSANNNTLGLSGHRWNNVYSQELNVTKASGNLSAMFTATNGLGTLEIGGSTGAFIDLKTPASDDFEHNKKQMKSTIQHQISSQSLL